jgi:hypothetical protein
MLIFKSKKASSLMAMLLFVIFELVLIGSFYFRMTSSVNELVSESTFIREKQSREIALIVDSMHSSNGDMQVSYSFSSPSKRVFQADLKRTSVEIVEIEREGEPYESKKTVFSFGANEYIEAVLSTIYSPSETFFILKDNKLYLESLDICNKITSCQDYCTLYSEDPSCDEKERLLCNNNICHADKRTILLLGETECHASYSYQTKIYTCKSYVDAKNQGEPNYEAEVPDMPRGSGPV